MKKILVTGGTGYIGSHTVVALINAGDEVVILDNLSNSSRRVIPRIAQITGVTPDFIEGDIADEKLMNSLFSNHDFDAVIHFAGLKSVSESVEHPEKYHQNNVEGTKVLLKAMADHKCYCMVFSSSATVYGDPASVPINEEAPLFSANPYGKTKLDIENILRDLSCQDARWQISILRYFNPVGAHPSGLIGEDPNGIPNNLMPYIAQVAVGKLASVYVFGNDYQTPDGTGVRDYIHVVDLAQAHLLALQNPDASHKCEAYNIGTGNGYSVLEMIEAFALASGKDVPYKIVERRPGDVASCYADVTLAEQKLGWKAKYGIVEMMRDHWCWQKNNPNGYQQ